MGFPICYYGAPNIINTARQKGLVLPCLFPGVLQLEAMAQTAGVLLNELFKDPGDAEAVKAWVGGIVK